MHRTTTAAALLTAVALALAGCSNFGTDSKPTAKTPAPASPSVDPIVPFMKSIEAARLDSYVTEGIPPFQELEVFPPEWCKALDEGHSVEWMLGDGGLYPIGQDWGTAKPDAYQLVVLGVKAYCPEHSAVVVEELRASGVY